MENCIYSELRSYKFKNSIISIIPSIAQSGWDDSLIYNDKLVGRLQPH